ncbi:MAG: internalization-related competence protein ComEC/Rec2 [Marmoricola sp.]|jgi:competence protein ComEC|nr:internalization-related competence protein ComEC/Rec2 [Marmoricola sp.]
MVAWLAAVTALLAPPWVTALTLGLCALRVLHRWRRGQEVLGRTAWLVAALGVSVSALLRAGAVHDNAVQMLAHQHASVTGTVVVGSDPVLRSGRFEDYVVFRARTESLTGRGVRHRVRVPVLVLGDARWQRLSPGSRVRVAGRMDVASTRELAGVLSTRGPPVVLDRPRPWLRAADRLRAAIREAVADQPEAPRALVPALVDGDDGGMPEELSDDFRTAGLTHLLAVSGTNLTLVVGCLLLLARWAGVRARGLAVVGALGVVGFVLLARTEPSVVRAAAMGSVGLVGMGHHGRRRGTRALGAAVLLLLLFDPWLALSPGFALSALATAGILWLAPGWRDQMMRWVPRWVAEAVAVPLAAQIACTPLVAAISGQVSLVAVVANLLAAPAVGPATVLGLAGGVVGLLSEPLGRLVATPAVWCAEWIIAVAVRSAGLPVAAVGWPASPVGIAVLASLCTVLSLFLGALLARRGTTVGLGAVMVIGLLVPLPSPGWPPAGWVMVACDVGQGDGLVLNAGPHTGVVVDAGPDPAAMDRCLGRLGIDRVPLVVLTHFHADHVDGLEGVLAGRQVGAVEVTSWADPLSGVRLVEGVAARAGVPVQRASYGETRRLGPLSWQVIAPSGPPSPDSDSPPNDSSLVLLVETRGIRLLLMGDEEDDSQAGLLRETGGVRADVLKVAHHGSAKQDPDLVRGLGARLAVISVGEDNDYGHPAPSLLALLRDARMQVARTDRDGDVAVVVEHGLRVALQG